MDKKEEIKCVEHCVCLEGFPSKKPTSGFEKELAKLSSKLNKELKVNALMLSAGTYTGVEKKKGKFRYSVSINSKKGAGENIETYYKIFPLLKVITKLSETLNWKPDRGMSCTHVYFSEKEFKLGGGLILPTALPSASNLSEKTGKPSLTGFNIRFAESPVGLEGVDIETSHEFGVIGIRCTHSFKPSTEKDIFSVTLNKSIELSRLFLVTE